MVIRTRETGLSKRLDRRPLPDGPVSFEEFLAWDEDDKAEWVDGEVRLLMPESKHHQRLVVFLVTLLQLYVARYDLGQVMTSFLFRLATRPSGRAPDIAFLAREHLDRLAETYVDGPADLAVEIVSPSSEQRDRHEKLAEYAAAGIPEYWLLDERGRDAAFFRLGGDGVYRRVLPDAEGIYHSEALDGFWLRVEWLWQDPAPLMPALGEMGLLPPEPR